MDSFDTDKVCMLAPFSAVIIGRSGTGKTTILRDLIKFWALNTNGKRLYRFSLIHTQYQPLFDEIISYLPPETIVEVFEKPPSDLEHLHRSGPKDDTVSLVVFDMAEQSVAVALNPTDSYNKIDGLVEKLKRRRHSSDSSPSPPPEPVKPDWTLGQVHSFGGERGMGARPYGKNKFLTVTISQYVEKAGKTQKERGADSVSLSVDELISFQQSLGGILEDCVTVQKEEKRRNKLAEKERKAFHKAQQQSRQQAVQYKRGSGKFSTNPY